MKLFITDGELFITDGELNRYHNFKLKRDMVGSYRLGFRLTAQLN